MGKKRPLSDHRADTRGAALSGLPHVVSDSAAWLDLTPFERAVFAEILRRFNGYNNGIIAISYDEIGARLKGRNSCKPNNGRNARAIIALWEHGFVAEARPGSWLQRKAREYRITFISSGKAPPFRQATNDYLRWAPRAKNDGDAASPKAPPSGDAQSPGANRLGDGQSPDDVKNGSFPCADQARSGDAGSLLIVKPSPTPLLEGVKPPLSTPNLAGGPISTGKAA